MTPEFQVWMTAALLVLARVSALIAVLPFFASARVPATIRAYIAIALSLAITPSLYGAVNVIAGKISEMELLGVFVTEVGIGLYLGFMVRVFFVAVAFTAEFISQQVGFMGMFVPSVTEGEMTTPLADLMGLFSAVLFFAMDIHLYLIRGVFTSYEVLPIATTIEVASLIDALAERVSTVFIWSLQLGAPFILYVTVCNLLLGLANRTRSSSAHSIRDGSCDTLWRPWTCALRSYGCHGAVDDSFHHRCFWFVRACGPEKSEQCGTCACAAQGKSAWRGSTVAIGIACWVGSARASSFGAGAGGACRSDNHSHLANG